VVMPRTASGILRPMCLDVERLPQGLEEALFTGDGGECRQCLPVCGALVWGAGEVSNLIAVLGLRRRGCGLCDGRCCTHTAWPGIRTHAMRRRPAVRLRESRLLGDAASNQAGCAIQGMVPEMGGQLSELLDLAHGEHLALRFH